MKRPFVLITGATGRLGQLLYLHLADAFELRRICLNKSSVPGVITADLGVVDRGLAHLFDGVDCVLHCAGQASPRAGWADVQRNNIDATLNVFAAAAQAGVRRVVFMSSNWTMAGYRFQAERLIETLPPLPINPYGVSKVVGECIGRSFAVHRGLSVICLRLGDCTGRAPGDPRLANRVWERQKWLSDRDFLQLVDRSIAVSDVQFATVNGMSMNAGMRWDLETGRRLLGYVPLDGLPGAGALARIREIAARYTLRAMRGHEWPAP
jgi:NAD+ dependent glucose-6-phosphate dehydrogenase